jgi:hypothetical protein
VDTGLAMGLSLEMGFAYLMVVTQFTCFFFLALKSWSLFIVSFCICVFFLETMVSSQLMHICYAFEYFYCETLTYVGILKAGKILSITHSLYWLTVIHIG